MADLTHRVCATCGRHQERKLWQFEGAWYCKTHWHGKITWHESRSNLISALQTGQFGVSVTKSYDTRPRERLLLQARAYCNQASFALKYGQEKQFIRSIVSAMWALEEAG